MTELSERRCEPCEGGVEPLPRKRAEELMRALHASWSLAADGKSIECSLRFPAFARTIAFVNAVAYVATVEGHHPEVTFGYGHCHVRFTTNAIDGLSDNDFICAAKIDRLAAADRD